VPPSGREFLALLGVRGVVPRCHPTTEPACGTETARLQAGETFHLEIAELLAPRLQRLLTYAVAFGPC